jgi:hypothetical protein
MIWTFQPGILRRLVPAFLSLGLVPVLAATPRHGHGHGHGQGAEGPLAGTLEIQAAGGGVTAAITYTNVSQRVVWLEKIDEGQAPPRPEFEIRSEGRLVAYSGPVAKRGPYTRADFFPLEPGRSHRRIVRLDECYAFPEGEHAYRATHAYLVWNDRTRQAVHRSLKPAVFTFAR